MTRVTSSLIRELREAGLRGRDGVEKWRGFHVRQTHRHPDDGELGRLVFTDYSASLLTPDQGVLSVPRPNRLCTKLAVLICDLPESSSAVTPSYE